MTAPVLLSPSLEGRGIRRSPNPAILDYLRPRLKKHQLVENPVDSIAGRSDDDIRSLLVTTKEWTDLHNAHNLDKPRYAVFCNSNIGQAYYRRRTVLEFSSCRPYISQKHIFDRKGRVWGESLHFFLDEGHHRSEYQVSQRFSMTQLDEAEDIYGQLSGALIREVESPQTAWLTALLRMSNWERLNLSIAIHNAFGEDGKEAVSKLLDPVLCRTSHSNERLWRFFNFERVDGGNRWQAQLNLMVDDEHVLQILNVTGDIAENRILYASVNLDSLPKQIIEIDDKRISNAIFATEDQLYKLAH